jgi:dTDP-glucose 4,6-dehydratase
MNVLVAGGAGFIGRSMCARLLDRGDEVACVDNLVTGSAENVKELARYEGFSLIEADVSLEVPVEGRFDAVINLACPASPADFAPLALEILRVGSQGVANLLEVARRNQATFLQASTSEVYGDPTVHPQPEEYWGNVNPIGVRSVYDEAKRFGEALTMAYQRRYGLEVRIARIFNTYGPGMRPDDGRVVSNFITQALRDEPLTIHGDGSQTRSLCFVEDEVSGLLALLESKYIGPVNIGSDDERTVLEIARQVIEQSGSGSRIAFTPARPDDPTQRCPDLTQARTRLGWQPTTALPVGLARTIEWFKNRIGGCEGANPFETVDACP